MKIGYVLSHDEVSALKKAMSIIYKIGNRDIEYLMALDSIDFILKDQNLKLVALDLANRYSSYKMPKNT